MDDPNSKDRDPTPVTPEASRLYYETLTLMDDVFLPALSLTESNCCLAGEIW